MAFFANTRKPPARRRDEDGYIMLTLMLVVALMVIAATAILPAMSYQIRRDREDEMIHRGVQYTRAIRAYFKKFGRYPTRLEDLDNSNNQRFLRRHYKDPVNKNQDFRLLHYGEQGVTMAGSINGGSIAGANPIGSPGASNGSGFSQPSGFGGNQNSAFGGNQNSLFGNSNTAFGGSNSPTSSNPASANPDQSQNSSSSSSVPQDTTPAEGGAGDQSSSSQPVIGGPIVGVASYSKDRGFHEFNHKKNYNDWQFVYDPATDRGGLITTPNQPSLALQGFGNQQQLNGAQPNNSNGSSFGNSNGSSFGNSNSSPFGGSSGFGNNPSPGNNQPPPSQPPSPQQPQ